ncbi:hypothetical protein MC885_012857, partial [Smutsia gigantea]
SPRGEETVSGQVPGAVPKTGGKPSEQSEKGCLVKIPGDEVKEALFLLGFLCPDGIEFRGPLGQQEDKITT